MPANTTNKTDSAEAKVEESSGKDVLYKGNATRRVISESDWASLPTPIQGQHREWTMSGNYRLPMEDFSKEELSYLSTDGGFTLVDQMDPDGE